MRQLVRRWFLKAGRDGAEGVYWAEDPSNSAVLAAGIRALQDNQQRVLGLGIENLLQAVDFGNIGPCRSFGFRPGEGYRFAVAWVDV
jgi:hypothetical protein